MTPTDSLGTVCVLCASFLPWPQERCAFGGGSQLETFLGNSSRTEFPICFHVVEVIDIPLEISF